jgi:hypothetical protein
MYDLCNLIDEAPIFRKATNNLSFNGLLNALDGVVAQEGRLVFMTTNHRLGVSTATFRSHADTATSTLPFRFT